MVRMTVKRQKDAPAKPADEPKRTAARPKTAIKTSRIDKVRTRQAMHPVAPAKPGVRKKVHDVQGRPQSEVRTGGRGRRA